MSKPIVIALAGDMGHGKTTVAEYLVRNHGALRYRFAGPIKTLVAELMIAAGEKRENAFDIVDCSAMKNTPIREMYQRSPRDLMRDLGDVGRAIDKEFWANITMNAIIADHRANPDRIFVIDDWRYAEGEGGRMLAGDMDVTFARVNRPDAPRALRDHSSEGGLDDWLYDFIITNRDRDLDGLYAQADKLAEMVLQYEVD